MQVWGWEWIAATVQVLIETWRRCSTRRHGCRHLSSQCLRAAQKLHLCGMGRHVEGVVVWLGQGQIAATVQAFGDLHPRRFTRHGCRHPLSPPYQCNSDLTTSRARRQYDQLHVQFDLSLVPVSFYVCDLLCFKTCFPGIHIRDR